MDSIIGMYLIIVNIAGFLAMGIDKIKAKKKAWRIPEKTLLGLAIAGGGLGVMLGMETFRHKTKHWYFKYGIPVILMVEISIILYFME